MIRPIQLGDLVRLVDVKTPRKRTGLVVGFDTKHGTGSIQVRWHSTACWATSWQLEVISESR